MASGQDGVDLYGEDRFGGSGSNGVQCKHHGSATPIKDKDLVEELREEVEKAKGFQPPLQRFVFATTARRSRTLDQEARDLTALHRKAGLFDVDVLGWEDIEDLLRRHFGVLAWYRDERAKVRELRLDLGRLPIPGPHFVGRDAELARLDAAWEDPSIHVLTLVAFGGVGKSALVARWLDRMSADGWRGAARVLDWSFYSQGSKDQNTSAEPFIDHALRFFGDPDPKAGSLHDRGARLAYLIRKERSLLVLDGIEPLQYPPGRPEIEGRLKDPGLAAHLSDEDWRLATTTLRDHSLLAAADPREPETLDAHPLVRACFAEELESRRAGAWMEGNRRLYEHLRQAAPDLPETLEAMQSLYAAVVHGCRAGLQQEAMNEVYWQRILRENEHFSWTKLGAFGSELTALDGFFDRPWSQPSDRLTVAAQALILNEVAFVLRALGRLAEAVEPMEAGLEAYTSQEDWKGAAAVASNLTELTLTLGNVPRAVAFGRQCVELADHSDDPFWKMASRTTWADALNQAGRWEESVAAFREAETIQAERQPEYTRLYVGLRGFQYCDLVLGRVEPEAGSGLDGLVRLPSRSEAVERGQEVLERAMRALESGKNLYTLLTIALDQLTLGRALVCLALTAPRSSAKDRAASQLDRAVDGLRRATQELHLPRGLLARAALRRLRSDFAGAAADLTEALEIAERGPMRLHECDAHLEWARLCRDQGDLDAARRHVARARVLVNETGYGRREREVRWLEGVVGSGVNGRAG